MTKAEKIIALTKYVESVKRILKGGPTPQLKAFFEREIKRSESKIARLR